MESPTGKDRGDTIKPNGQPRCKHPSTPTASFDTLRGLEGTASTLNAARDDTRVGFRDKCQLSNDVQHGRIDAASTVESPPGEDRAETRLSRTASRTARTLRRCFTSRAQYPTHRGGARGEDACQTRKRFGLCYLRL